MHSSNAFGTLYFGDAVEFMRSMPAECVDCIVTDPPYRVISGGMRLENAQNGYARSTVKGIENGRVFSHNDCAPETWIPEAYRLLRPGSHAYIMTNNLNLERILSVSRETGFHFSNLLIWKKNNVNANRYYMKNTELTLFFQKKPARTINNPGSAQVFECDNPRNKVHPTEKPAELMTHYIENSTQPWQVVLDPFAGSGATAVAASRLSRQWVSFEKDPMYYLHAAQRIMKL